MAPVVQPEPFSWTGFYIGGNIGGVWNDYRLGAFVEDVEVQEQFEELEAMTFRVEGDQKVIFDSVFEKFGGHSRTDGSLFGGGQLGYNHQFGHWVLGFEADFDGLGTSAHRREEFGAEQNNGIFGAVTFVEATRSAHTCWNASARLRGGYAWDRFLFYTTWGAAFADVEGKADDIATSQFFSKGPIGTVIDTNRSTRCRVLTGWTGGLGGEYAITRTVSVGFEWRYSNFGGDTYPWDNHDTPINPGENGIDLSSHQVTARVNILLCNLFGKH